MSTATALVVSEVYDRIDNPMDFVERFGTMMHASGMLGCTNKEQGMVMAMVCLAERKNPIELARTYHIIGGRLSMRADAMLAEFRKLGGRCIWTNIGSDGQVSSARFIYQDNDIEVSYTLEDAKTAKLIKEGGGWTKNPDAMLRARVISKAIRMLAPEVCAGYYTPEEVEDFAPAPAPVQERKAAKPIEEILRERAGREALRAVAEEATPSLGSEAEAAVDADASREVAAKRTRTRKAKTFTVPEAAGMGATSDSVTGPSSTEQQDTIELATTQIAELEGNKSIHGRIITAIKNTGKQLICQLNWEEAEDLAQKLAIKITTLQLEQSLAKHGVHQADAIEPNGHAIEEEIPF